MTGPMEPPRWLSDERIDPFVGRLLRAGRNDAPTEKNLLAAPAAIAALLATHTVSTSAAAAGTAFAGSAAAAKAGAAATAATVTKAVTATAATASAVPGAAVVGTAGIAAATVGSPGAVALLPVLVKAIALGLVVGGTAVAAAVKVAPARSTLEPAPVTSTPAVSQTVVRPKAERSLAVPVVSAKPSTSAVVPEHAHEVAPVVATSSREGVEIAREVQRLDAARAALRAGELQRAIEHLDAYARLGRRSLEPESTVLRVKTLLAMHRRAEAVRIAREFSLGAPNSPHANELSRLVAEGHSDDSK